MFPPRPFWFASEELLTDLFHAEIKTVAQLLAERPNLASLFEVPEATIPECRACFMLLAHRKIVETIDDTFVAREQSPSLGGNEKDVLKSAQNLFADDAPAWVLEVNEVAGLLPSRIYDTLPEPLRRGGLNRDDPEQVRAFESARNDLGEMQALIGRVLEEQLRRLEDRWTAPAVRGRGPNKRKGWEQKLKLYDVIQRVLSANPKLEGMAFCAELDKHHAKPLLDWVEKKLWREGLTWKEAWGDPALIGKIRRVRQEALKTRRL